MQRSNVPKIVARCALATAALTLLAACSSSASPGTDPTSAGSSTPPAVSSAPVVVPPPTHRAVDPNTAACRKAQRLMTGRVVDTFDSWHPDSNEFDQRVARQLRAEATQMLGLAASARHGVAVALHDEGRALTDLSIALEERDDSAVGQASDEANSALADVRGSCNF